MYKTSVKDVNVNFNVSFMFYQFETHFLLNGGKYQLQEYYMKKLFR